MNFCTIIPPQHLFLVISTIGMEKNLNHLLRWSEVAVAELPFAIVSTKLTAGGLGGGGADFGGRGGMWGSRGDFIQNLGNSWDLE